MRLVKLDHWILIVVLVTAALILAVLSHSFIREGGWGWAAHRNVELVRRPPKGPADLPVFAYWISGTGGDSQKILRLLRAVYHPRNLYLLHLDAGSSPLERSELERLVRSENLFRAFGNVDVIGQSYAVDRVGPSAVAATLHGAAILLRLYPDWDWFITLSAWDYPLVTPDDLLHVFSYLPRNLNFIDHTSDLGWKEYERFDKIIVDPSLYMGNNSQLLVSSGTRKTPDSFKIFIGSPWVILSRPFVAHCVQGTDNLPRILLMYFANVAYSIESYFQTVICNSPEFKNTTINHDLRYFVWDEPPGLQPLFLNGTHLQNMIKSRAAFARRFAEGNTVLNKVDKKLLRHIPSRYILRHCSIKKKSEVDECLSAARLIGKPSPSAMRLRSLVTELISSEKLHSNQCKI